MPKTVAIKRRIRSVSNTKQITKAMELVAASKLRRAADTALRANEYSLAIFETTAQVVTEEYIFHPLVVARPVRKALVLVFASDRGLAGAYNSYIQKEVQELYAKLGKDKVALSVMSFGNQAAKMVVQLPNVQHITDYTAWTENPSMRDVRAFTSELAAHYSAGVYDGVYVVATRFYSAIRQQAYTRQLLPFRPQETEAERTNLESDDDVTEIISQFVRAIVLEAATGAVASEHAMRMMAMKNATDNAGDLIDDLTLQFNNARQSAITQELSEISGGVAALS